MSTALADRLITRIARTGPISLADYMMECLLHPVDGYYTTGNPLGREGDFITAPEISQMFGEMIGLALAQAWMDQGAPSPVHLVELGPGRGTLMNDLLRATRAVPGFHAAATLHLVEASPRLRAQQSDLLAAHEPTFHDTIETVPEGPTLLIANEFFDALPIRQFQRDEGDGWRERVVGLQDGVLTLGLAPPQTVSALAGRRLLVKPGQIVETNAPAEAIAGEIGRRIAQFGGVAMFIDYGDGESIGDTFQAVMGHKSVDPFAAPGHADLTAHVAFAPLARAAASARASSLTPQGVFLERLGITARAQSLARALSGEPLERHIAAHRRLTHPEEMGNLFKVLALSPPDAPLPAGLD